MAVADLSLVWPGRLRPLTATLLTGKVGNRLCAQLGNHEVNRTDRCITIAAPIGVPICGAAGAGPW